MRIPALLLTGLACAPLFAQQAVRLQVDASNVSQRLFHVRMTLPASPGPETLLYPEWIPGEHGPTGPIVNLVGLKISANGNTVAWRRDDVDMYAFHVNVPAGASALDVAFDFISPPDSPGFSAGSSTTSQLAVISWNQLVLYPQGKQPDGLRYQATLRLPESWRFGTALPVRRQLGSEVEFETVPLSTLIDSPVSAGAFYRVVDLGTDRGAPHFLDLAADSEAALQISPKQTAEYKRLVAETGALFGVRHYRYYHFLFTLSDHVAHFGLEHHESSDDRVSERTLIDDSDRILAASLLPHEFVHSWNGKYRRPIGLAGGDHDGGYDFPMKGELLWVYEGLTNYLGEILTPRSGLLTPEQFRDSLALTAAELDREPGRKWRPLADTAVAAQVLYNADGDYANYRRGVDFYPEGTLLWLEADVRIRELSHGAKSLNDFCKAFFGGPGGAPAIKPYNFEDVVTALNAVQPYDWAGFFRSRVYAADPESPLRGIERGGWKLVYTDKPSEFWRALEAEHKVTDLSYSLGFKVKSDGSVTDVLMGSPVQKAGFAPSMQVIAVNGRQYTPEVLHDAVKATAAGPKTIELLCKNGEYYETRKVEYAGGEKYPSLVRDSAAHDYLSEIVAPLAGK